MDHLTLHGACCTVIPLRRPAATDPVASGGGGRSGDGADAIAGTDFTPVSVVGTRSGGGNGGGVGDGTSRDVGDDPGSGIDGGIGDVFDEGVCIGVNDGTCGGVRGRACNKADGCISWGGSGARTTA